MTSTEQMDLRASETQVVSKKRVNDHGEVYTAPREVNAMLDLVKQETDRIESRFLEPACGTGNFLIEILERKLRVVTSRYKKSQTEYERYAILAVSSIYGIDILKDNVVACRQRLLGVFSQRYINLYKKRARGACFIAANYILERNIIWGDALTLKTRGDNPEPIVFSEWSPVNGSMFKRRDFTFKELITPTNDQIFAPVSDLGKDVFIPAPVKEYPLIHFLKVADAENQ